MAKERSPAQIAQTKLALAKAHKSPLIGKHPAYKRIAKENALKWYQEQVEKNMMSITEAQLIVANMPIPNNAVAKERQYVIDRLMGPMKQGIELTGEGGGAVHLGITVTDAVKRAYKPKE